MLDLKAVARRIFRETLTAIDIPRAMEHKLARSGSRIRAGEFPIDLRDFDHIRVVAFGKAAFGMCEGLLRVLAPDFPATGILVVPAAPQHEMPGIETFVAGHPVPTRESFAAARAILRLLSECGGRSLVFFLVSGGGSALVELPLDSAVSLEGAQTLHHLLVTCGAPIDEVNAVRKHLSAVKGGRLAAAAPATMKITLGVTDVPPGRESALASGPTLPDPTTVEDAYGVVERYGLLEKLPASIRTQFERRTLVETPKAGDAAFARAHFEILLGLDDLFHPAHRAAEAEGFVTFCDNSTDDRPLEKALDYLLDQLLRQKQANAGRPVVLLADGELRSPVTGNGIGGRNAAFVLRAVGRIAGKPLAVASAGTDGIDGSSPAAGAVADGETLARARAAGLDPEDYFRRSDSYTFFQKLGDAIETGPTGNNLRDLRILLAL